jgi:hypothetical protein
MTVPPIAELTRGTAGLAPALTGASIFLFGGFLIVIVELALAGGRTPPASLAVGCVVMAFLGQAAVRLGLTKGIQGLRGVGWITVAFNLGGLSFLLIASRNDMYFPVAHLVMPAVIAIALLLRQRSSNKQSTHVRQSGT